VLTASAEAKPTVVEQPKVVEQVVRNYFSDTPVLSDIAWCESKFRHFDNYGAVLKGEVVSTDIGVMQINEYYHGKTADTFGIDIYTLTGNLKYARYLYEKEGTTPWLASVKCWGYENHITKA
jgi:hypothetical protein